MTLCKGLPTVLNWQSHYYVVVVSFVLSFLVYWSLVFPTYWVFSLRFGIIEVWPLSLFNEIFVCSSSISEK